MHKQNRFNGPAPRLCIDHNLENRLRARGISTAGVAAALDYGRPCWKPGGRAFVIGRKEARQHGNDGLELWPYEGLWVECSADGIVQNAFRDRRARRLRGRSHPRNGAERLVV